VVIAHSLRGLIERDSAASFAVTKSRPDFVPIVTLPFIIAPFLFAFDLFSRAKQDLQFPRFFQNQIKAVPNGFGIRDCRQRISPAHCEYLISQGPLMLIWPDFFEITYQQIRSGSISSG